MERKGRDYTLTGALGNHYFFSVFLQATKGRKTPISLGLAVLAYFVTFILMAGFIVQFLLH
jgi:hypothetical protein